MAENKDIAFMSRALELAKKAWGETAPNPMVGAVVVKDGKIIGEGWHRRDGGPHAEINALRGLGEAARGAAIYVTLEPCSTKGRTGACSEAIIACGISRVVIGSLDPNPLHAGRAVRIFEENGIECVSGVMGGECGRLNFIFNHAIVKKEALAALKVARTSNGKIAETAGKPSKITESEARMHAMRYRRLFPAIGVGLGTLVADNPALTCRMEGKEDSCGMRLIFDRSLNCAAVDPGRFKMFCDSFAPQTHVVCDADSPADRQKKLESMGVSVMRMSSPRADERLFWTELKRRLYERGANGIIIEGGAKIFSSLASSGSADYMFEYVSPKTFPDSAPDAFDGCAPEIADAQIVRLGEDTCRFGPIASARKS